MHLKYLGVHIILKRSLADELHTVNWLRSYFDRISSYVHFKIDCLFSNNTCVICSISIYITFSDECYIPDRSHYCENVCKNGHGIDDSLDDLTTNQQTLLYD